MATISIPAATHINVVATEFDYSQKSNLGTERTGSYLSQASMLVYDDILRFQRSSAGYTGGLTAEKVDAFNYNQFEGNILWFMDELVGMESDWIQDASNDETTAYGYVQFTEDSVETAVNRYIGHLERFNERKDIDRGWKPYSIKKHETLPIPEWLTTLKNSTKTHKEKLDALTYDEVLALAFVHLHSKKSKDSNFVLLAEGNIYASKELYKNNHHTNPDAATLTRLEGFFPWRKQNRYAAALASYSATSIAQACTFSTINATAQDVIDCLKAKLTMKSGADLAADFANQTGQTDPWGVIQNVQINDVTPQVHPGQIPRQYTDWHQDLISPISGTLKAFEFIDQNTSRIGYYYYRENGATIWLQNLKKELNDNAADYNFDELCQTIDSWGNKALNVPLSTYFIDWWIYDIADPQSVYQTGFNFVVPNRPVGGGPPSFGISNGYRDEDTTIQTGGILVIGMSTQPTVRGQFTTVFHEAGGHAVHAGEWGYGLRGGVDFILSRTQETALLTLYQNYLSVKYAEYYANFPSLLQNPPVTSAGSIAFKEKAFDHLPMANIIALSRYTQYSWNNIEDEFLARIYSIMAINKCITFEKDIWPVMVQNSPAIDPNIIDINIAKQIDLEMKTAMKLNMRTY